MKKIILLFTVVYACVTSCYCQPGSIDVSFGNKGFVETNLGTIYKSTAIQKDGKIVTAGYCSNCNNSAFAIARYNSNGSLDNSFNGDGSLILPIGTNDNATSVAIQSDGKILVAGYANVNNNYDFAVVRLNSNGSLDSTFSSDGKLTTDFDLRPNYARSIVVSTDGKIIVGGGFDIAKYNANGTPDNTFDGDGKLSTNNDFNSLSVQSDGKIVAVSNNNLVRFNTTGSPDNSFGSNGLKALTVHDLFRDLEEWEYGASFIITQVRIQSDGKILAAGFGGRGERYASNQYRAFVARYNSDGGLDISYAGDGSQQIPFYDLSNNTSIALQDDGKVVVAANMLTDVQYSEYGYNLVQPGFAFARLTMDGGLDYTFGTNGIQYGEFDQIISIENIAIANNKLYAVGNDKSVSNSSFLSRYLLGENKAPIVNLINPLNNAVYISPATITLNASASDSDGVVSKVLFYNGGTLLNTDSISPYTYTMNNVAAGSYSFTAKATDNKGLRSSSAGASVTVLAAPNKAPTVKITSPANNKIYTAPAMINLTAAASDSDGTISRVEFYNGGTLLKIDSTSPYTFTMSNVAAGNYAFIAKATDNKGLSGTSVSVPVAVSMPANKAPLVKLISPANNSVYFAAGSITLSATASDSDGVISKVQFYNGSSQLNTDGISPYTYTISNIAAGNYSFVAKAIDEKGLRSSSASVAVTVVTAPNKAPVVKMTSPSTDAHYLAPATINLNATASDADGTVTKVQFFNGGVLLKTDSTSPYSFTMDNVAPGRYSFVAKATDNKGLSNSSTSVPVLVQSNKEPIVQIVTPGDNTFYYTPVTATLIANASDSDGVISYVEFYNGQALLKRDSVSDYTLSLNNLAPGSYSIIAKATDNNGLISSSGVVHITVVSKATLEAEDASLSGPVIANNQPGFTGTGFADFIHASDDLIIWSNVVTTTPGQYLLEFRYANGGTTNRSLELAIDGYLIDASLNFPPTGSWTNWFTSSISVTLDPGAHNIWLFSSGSNGPNLDHLVFGSDNSLKLVQKSLVQQNITSGTHNIFKAFLSPNPVQDKAKLMVSPSSELPISFQLVDILGRTYKFVKFIKKGSNTFDFSVNELPTGSYIIILKQGQLTTHVQFIIAKK